MKIGVLSDTHLHEPHPQFKRMIETHFRDVEKIFHTGDFVDLSVAEYLASQKELIAVFGNMDPREIREVFPRKRVIEIGKFRIGLVHGGGAPFGMESRVRDEFDEACTPELQRRGVDAVVYGHTHTPAHHQVKNIYFFNPGSPTRSFIHRPTLGILYVGDKIEGEIIQI
jgi:hypothetical protein